MLELRVCIDVEDLDKGIAFYTQVLGLKLGRRFGNQGASPGPWRRGRGYDEIAGT